MPQVNWQEVYKNEVPFFKALRQFVDRPKFGLETREGTPYHVNPADDPFPQWHRHAACRSERHLRHRDVLHHLEGTCALFIVNSPQNHAHEITFDIDAVD